MSTSAPSPIKKSLYTKSFTPVSVITTGIWTFSPFVWGFTIISIPGLSSFDFISIFSVECLISATPSFLRLKAPSVSPVMSANVFNKIYNKLTFNFK